DTFRDTHPQHTIVDVQYADLMADPAGTVARIYQACGDVLDDDAAAAIDNYAKAHPKGQFGAHRYDLTEFGLDGDQLSERFAEYPERYTTPRELSPASQRLA